MVPESEKKENWDSVGKDLIIEGNFEQVLPVEGMEKQ